MPSSHPLLMFSNSSAHDGHLSGMFGDSPFDDSSFDNVCSRTRTLIGGHRLVQLNISSQRLCSLVGIGME
jgi:hypothetical protein